MPRKASQLPEEVGHDVKDGASSRAKSAFYKPVASFLLLMADSPDCKATVQTTTVGIVIHKNIKRQSKRPAGAC